ncbi:MAG: hypothetical protein ACRD1K_19955 [Acidimicrobiales bacterium]
MEVEGVLAVARSTAEATAETGQATANALELLGQPLLPLLGVTGGTQVGPGITEGDVIDTGDIGVGRVAVGQYAAEVEQSIQRRQARAETALLRLVLLDPALLALDVLQSLAEASHTGGVSAGAASSDGAVRALGAEGGLVLVLLHSEASSTNGASSFVVGLNNLELITDQDVGNAIDVLNLPGLLTLGLVGTDGGLGGLASATGVDLNVLDDTVAATAAGVTASGTPRAAPAPGELGQVDTGAGGSSGGGSSGSGGSGGGGLASTGGSIALMAALGLGLVVAGAGVYRFGRTRLA